MKRIPPKTPTKRKVMKEGKEKGSPKIVKKRRQNGDMKRYISCKKWREEESRGNHDTEMEKKEEGDKLVGMGSRVDTTSPPVTVNMTEMTKSMIETLKIRWKDEKTKIERERVLRRIECWTNQDLQVHML